MLVEAVHAWVEVHRLIGTITNSPGCPEGCITVSRNGFLSLYHDLAIWSVKESSLVIIPTQWDASIDSRIGSDRE
jgi:hypothetical protein